MKTPFLLSFFALPVFISLPLPGKAGIDPLLAAGARAAALGNAYVGLRADLWSQRLNPAGLAGLSRPLVGLGVSRQSLLNSGSALFAIPFLHDRHTLGVDARRWGFEAYQETRLAFSYATEVLEQISMGVKGQYVSLNIPGYGRKDLLWVDAGLIAALSPELRLGVSLQNASRSRLRQGEVSAPVMTMGLAFQPNSRLTVLADLQKDAGHALCFRAGTEYYLSAHFCMRLGVSTAPMTCNAGVGIKKARWQLDTAISYHPQMGFTPQLSALFSLTDG